MAVARSFKTRGEQNERNNFCVVIILTCTNCGGERDDNVWRVEINPPMPAVLMLCPKCRARMTLASVNTADTQQVHDGNTAEEGVGTIGQCRWCPKRFIREKANQKDCSPECHNAYHNDRKKRKPPEGEP